MRKLPTAHLCAGPPAAGAAMAMDAQMHERSGSAATHSRYVCARAGILDTNFLRYRYIFRNTAL
eukprot:scaffold166225_cov35-Tisochrysis_lutea.AAC.5